jgi:hypothetical protein
MSVTDMRFPDADGEEKMNRGMQLNRNRPIPEMMACVGVTCEAAVVVVSCIQPFDRLVATCPISAPQITAERFGKFTILERRNTDLRPENISRINVIFGISTVSSIPYVRSGLSDGCVGGSRSDSMSCQKVRSPF